MEEQTKMLFFAFLCRKEFVHKSGTSTLCYYPNEKHVGPSAQLININLAVKDDSETNW